MVKRAAMYCCKFGYEKTLRLVVETVSAKSANGVAVVAVVLVLVQTGKLWRYFEFLCAEWVSGSALIRQQRVVFSENTPPTDSLFRVLSKCMSGKSTEEFTVLL